MLLNAIQAFGYGTHAHAHAQGLELGKSMVTALILAIPQMLRHSPIRTRCTTTKPKNSWRSRERRPQRMPETDKVQQTYCKQNKIKEHLSSVIPSANRHNATKIPCERVDTHTHSRTQRTEKWKKYENCEQICDDDGKRQLAPYYKLFSLFPQLAQRIMRRV